MYFKISYLFYLRLLIWQRLAQSLGRHYKVVGKGHSTVMGHSLVAFKVVSWYERGHCISKLTLRFFEVMRPRKPIRTIMNITVCCMVICWFLSSGKADNQQIPAKTEKVHRQFADVIKKMNWNFRFKLDKVSCWAASRDAAWDLEALRVSGRERPIWIFVLCACHV